MSELWRVKSMGVSVAALLCMLTLVGCPVPTPVIDSITPSEVPATESIELTIEGSDFAELAVVIFSNEDLGEIDVASPTSVADDGTSLTVMTPVLDIDEPTQVNVVVENPTGRTSDIEPVTFNPPPDLISVFPTSVPAQVSTQIALTGTNLDPGAEVCFISNVGEFGCTTLSAGQTVMTPELEGTVGPTLVSIQITNDDGQTDTLAGALLYEAAPTVLEVQPGEVPATISTEISILGTGFDNGATVTFTRSNGETFEEFFALDCGGDCGDTQILTGDSPAVEGLEDDECLTVSVAFSSGTGTENKIVKALGTLCLIAPPQIAGVSPAEVPSATVDAEVTLSGPNLRDGSTVIASIPDGSSLRFGNGVPAWEQEQTEVEVSDVEFADLVGNTELTFVRPVIEDNPLTPQFEGVRADAAVELTVVDEFGQVSDDVVTVGYNTSPRILGVSPEVVPSTVPVTFLATMNSVDLDGTDAGDLSFYFFDAESGEVLDLLGEPAVELWELIDPNVDPDPELPTVAVRGVTPTADILTANPSLNAAVVVTNDDGQRAVYPITYSPEAEILSVRNTDTGYAEVGATASAAPAGGSYPAGFPVGRTIRIEGFDFNDDSYDVGMPVEIRFSMLGQDTTDDGVDEDGTLLDIIVATIDHDSSLGVDFIEVEPPVLPCGAINEDTLVQVRISKADGQGTSEAAVGTIVYKAQPQLTSIVTVPNEGATHTDGEFPATIPTLFTVEGQGIASAQYLGLPRPQLQFDSSDAGIHLATVPMTTGSLDGSSPLVGLELLSSPDPTASDVAQGRTPIILGLTAHEDVSLTLYDAYGQASLEASACTTTGPLTLFALAPPQVAAFTGNFTDCAGDPASAPNLVPGTDQVTATFEIDGSLFTPGIIVEFYEDSALVSGFYQPIGEPFATLLPADLGGDSSTVITGTVPPLLEPGDDTEVNVSIVLVAQDGQRSVAFPGIKYVGLPEVTSVIVSGSDDALNGDAGDSYFITNGPFRNAFDGADDPDFLGVPISFEIFGSNLDCRDPVTGTQGLVTVTLSAGATATAETVEGDLLGASVPGNTAVTTDVTEGTLTFGIVDQASTYAFNGVTAMRSMTDGYGYVDIVEICDCVGQRSDAPHEDVLSAIQGPATTSGRGMTIATGDVDGDDIDDVATMSATIVAAAAYYTYINVWYGTDNDIVPIEPDFSYDLGSDPNLPVEDASVFASNARNLVIADFKGDGFGDLIVGLPDRSFTGAPATTPTIPTDATEGAVAYFDGTSGGILDPDYIEGDATAPASGFGATVAAGFINDDEFADLVVGAPGWTDTGVANQNKGRAYVFLGGPQFAQSLTFPGEDFNVSPSNQENLDYFSLGLTVGDYTNDDFEDIFAGSPGFDTFSGTQGSPYENTGRVYQYNGGSNLDDTPDSEFAGGELQIGFEAGYPVAGDFDGDGVTDLFIGRPGLGLDLPLFESTIRDTGDVLAFLGSDGSPLDADYELVLMDNDGLLIATGAGYSAGIAPVDSAEVLISGPQYDEPFNNGNPIDPLKGIVQRFQAGDAAAVIADDTVGVDTSEAYLSLMPITPGTLFWYGQHMATGNFLQASEGTQDFLISLPRVNNVANRSAVGLVIVPDGVTFGK